MNDLIHWHNTQKPQNLEIASNKTLLFQRWLDANKSVKKQVGVNAQFWLAVRFYPPEPSRLAEEYTKYLLFLQLKKLLLDGRMTAPKNTALLLASFTVQGKCHITCRDTHTRNI